MPSLALMKTNSTFGLFALTFSQSIFPLFWDTSIPNIDSGFGLDKYTALKRPFAPYFYGK
jgi:hypothetical protein